MINGYIQFSCGGKTPTPREKGISFKQLFIFIVVIIAVVYTTKNDVDKDIIKALISNLLK